MPRHFFCQGMNFFLNGKAKSISLSTSLQFNLPNIKKHLPLLLLNIKEKPQRDLLMMAVGHDRDDHLSGTISHHSQLFVCVPVPCVCGHAMHRNVAGLNNTFNFFHRFLTNKQPNNYTATQRAISTCCLSHCGSTPVSYRPLHKINIVTHSWYYPNYFI